MIRMDREAAPDWIPIFPLENVVLFPKVRVPLHIFEPRYRQMTGEAISGHGRIGMVTTLPEHAGAGGPIPPVFTIGCEGQIGEHERLPDGRYNIVLFGMGRFRILEEKEPDEERAFRIARVERLGEISPASAAEHQEIAVQRGEIIDRLGEWIRRTREEEDPNISEDLLRPFDDETFVNLLSQSVDFDPAEKQALLECDAISQRIAQLNGLLRFRLSEPAQAKTGRPSLH